MVTQNSSNGLNFIPITGNYYIKKMIKSTSIENRGAYNHRCIQVVWSKKTPFKKKKHKSILLLQFYDHIALEPLYASKGTLNLNVTSFLVDLLWLWFYILFFFQGGQQVLHTHTTPHKNVLASQPENEPLGFAFFFLSISFFFHLYFLIQLFFGHPHGLWDPSSLTR